MDLFDLILWREKTRVLRNVRVVHGSEWPWRGQLVEEFIKMGSPFSKETPAYQPWHIVTVQGTFSLWGSILMPRCMICPHPLLRWSHRVLGSSGTRTSFLSIRSSTLHIYAVLWRWFLFSHIPLEISYKSEWLFAHFPSHYVRIRAQTQYW